MEVEVCLVDGIAEVAVDHGVEEVSLDGGGDEGGDDEEACWDEFVSLLQ